tara:strand:+ start:144 stop:944 length:801 start_codon:yes stop_codon:yes gene_type:complete
MILKKKTNFFQKNNFMSNEGNIIAAREYFFEKKNKNLYYLLKNRYDWMNDYINNSDEVIELGSGPGLSKYFINNKNFKISDISNYNFLDYKNIDAMNTKFDNNSFDVVISSNMIHHIAYPLKHMEEVYRILKPGGLYIVQEVNCSIMLQIIIILLKIEGFDFTSDVTNRDEVCTNKEDPFSGNNAIPNLIFDNFEKFNSKNEFKFKLLRHEYSEFLSFINSGGVIAKTKYIPLNDYLNKFLINVDKLLSKFNKIFPLQQKIILKKY